MGVYIPNMEMPKSCWDCELLSSCKAMPKNPTADEIGTYTVMRLKDCPLIDIVRCKECKYYGESEFIKGDTVCKYHIGHTYYTEADRFCCYGERRTDE